MKEKKTLFSCNHRIIRPSFYYQIEIAGKPMKNGPDSWKRKAFKTTQIAHFQIRVPTQTKSLTGHLWSVMRYKSLVRSADVFHR